MKVLVAIDGSDSSIRALRYVLDHPGMFGPVPYIVLVNVHLPIPSVRAKAVLGADVVAQYYREESEEDLAPARALAAADSCNVTERRMVGQPSEQIIDVAIKDQCDVIVMGTHGQSALKSLFMGSVAMKVIADAPCPVMMVR